MYQINKYAVRLENQDPHEYIKREFRQLAEELFLQVLQEELQRNFPESDTVVIGVDAPYLLYYEELDTPLHQNFFDKVIQLWCGLLPVECWADDSVAKE